MDNKRYWDLLTKKVSGELSLQEHVELNNLLNEDEEHAMLTSFVDEIMHASMKIEMDEDEVEHFIATIQNKTIARKQPSIIKISWYKYFAAAASVLIVFALGLYFYFNKVKNASIANVPNLVITKKGNKSNIVLPDGTKVWINSDSKISYDAQFGVKERSVTLDGEAYFDVTKDKIHPFVVKTKAMDVKVFGTAFNVRAYEDEKTTQTTLLRGSVEVTLRNETAKKIMLKPNEKIVVQNDYNLPSPEKKEVKENERHEIILSTVIQKPKDSIASEVGWVSNKLVFNQETLEDIIPVLERWYDVKIYLDPKITSNHLLSGTYENDSIEDVLESLKMAGDFNYNIEKGEIYIHNR